MTNENLKADLVKEKEEITKAFAQFKQRRMECAKEQDECTTAMVKLEGQLQLLEGILVHMEKEDEQPDPISQDPHAVVEAPERPKAE